MTPLPTSFGLATRAELGLAVVDVHCMTIMTILLLRRYSIIITAIFYEAWAALSLLLVILRGCRRIAAQVGLAAGRVSKVGAHFLLLFL